ncbi:MAG: hypothetical protein CVU64_17565 [Deltaproteobacteria bacterium HGW-Deltaproteobacteria-21]|nr:MAG: hypothetical protein CVU64_17565 [Deltaproteobacteria bacterium HGW-Deltaproteobacteria-21]
MPEASSLPMLPGEIVRPRPAEFVQGVFLRVLPGWKKGGVWKSMGQNCGEYPTRSEGVGVFEMDGGGDMCLI